MNQFIAIVGSKEYHNLFVILATNFKEKLDAAVIRDGRVGYHIFIGPMIVSSTIKMIRAGWEKSTKFPDWTATFDKLVANPVFKVRKITIEYAISKLILPIL